MQGRPIRQRSKWILGPLICRIDSCHSRFQQNHQNETSKYHKIKSNAGISVRLECETANNLLANTVKVGRGGRSERLQLTTNFIAADEQSGKKETANPNAGRHFAMF